MSTEKAIADLFIPLLQGFTGKAPQPTNANNDGAIPLKLLTLA
jgi:hypothetical protein